MNSKNFSYLDNLIKNSKRKVTLDCDIILDESEVAEYKKGIIIDSPITIDGKGHTVDAGEMLTIMFDIKTRAVAFKNITLKNMKMMESRYLYPDGMGFVLFAAYQPHHKYYGSLDHSGRVSMENVCIEQGSVEISGGKLVMKNCTCNGTFHKKFETGGRYHPKDEGVNYKNIKKYPH